VNLFRYPDGWKRFVTFRNATILVGSLFLVTNAMFYALGKASAAQRQDIPWSPAITRTPMFLLSDVAIVTVLLVVVYRVGIRSQHYRTAVTIYAMLLANAIGALRSYLFLRTGF
jgi:hypothetical protein